MTYGDFKDLERTTASDKVLRVKALNIAKNPKFDGYQRGLASIVYKFFDKKSFSFTDKSVSGKGVNIEVKYNEQLAEELHKPTVRKLKKKVYSGFKNNIWGADCMFLSCHVRVFRVNPHSIVAWMSRNSLLEAGTKSEGEVTPTGIEPRTTYFLNEHSTIWPNWPIMIQINQN